MTYSQVRKVSMKTITNFMFALCPAVILAACAAGGEVGRAPRSDQDAAKIMASNDSLIVPGDRVGRGFLGMSVAQLYRAMGDPNSSMAFDDGGFSYDWNNLHVVVNQSKTVTWMVVSGPTYSLSDGITVASSTRALKSKRPTPAFSKAADATHNSYCYA